jgi:hypothetical protein
MDFYASYFNATAVSGGSQCLAAILGLEFDSEVAAPRIHRLCGIRL